MNEKLAKRLIKLMTGAAGGKGRKVREEETRSPKFYECDQTLDTSDEPVHKES